MITKAMAIEKCNTKEELIEELRKIIETNKKEETLNKIEKIIKLILLDKIGQEEVNKMLNQIYKKREGGDSMLTVIDRIENQARREGKKEGKRDGIAENKIEIAKRLSKIMDIKQIAKIVKLDEKEIEKII